MLATLNAITPIFLIIAIGYLLFRTRIVGEEVWSAIEHLCFYLLLPFLIIRTLSRANLGSVPVADFSLVLVSAMLGMSVLLILIHTILRRRYPGGGPTFTSLFQGITRFHGFVALATIGPLYGDDGVTLAALALAIMVPMLNMLSVVVLSLYGSGSNNPEFRAVFMRVLRNPLIIAWSVATRSAHRTEAGSDTIMLSVIPEPSCSPSLGEFSLTSPFSRSTFLDPGGVR